MLPKPGSTTTTSSSEFGRGKTLIALIVVIGCFAILWPKIFYPMLTSSLFPSSSLPGEGGHGGDLCCDVISEKDTNAYKLMNEICMNILKKEGLNLTSPIPMPPSPPPRKQIPDPPPKNRWYKNYTAPIQNETQSTEYPPPNLSNPRSTLCRNQILTNCKIDVTVLLDENPIISKEYKESLIQLRSFNISQCLKFNYGVHLESIGLPKRYKVPDMSPSHMRPERPIHMPPMMHPALREKGSAIPHPVAPRRTMDMEARPGPQPGVRPPMGGGLNTPPPRGVGGTMGIVMPLYTIGIVCFFLYTIFKILFKKSEDQSNYVKPAQPFPLDPEHRKYVLADEYEATNNRSIQQDSYARRSSSNSGIIRRRSSNGVEPIPTIPIIQNISIPTQTAPIAISSDGDDDDDGNKTLEPNEGPRERDTIVTAMNGILEQMNRAHQEQEWDKGILEEEVECKLIETTESTKPEVIQTTPSPDISEICETSKGKLLKGPDGARKKESLPKRPPTPICQIESDHESEEEEPQQKEKELELVDPEQQSPELLQFAQDLSAAILKQGIIESATVPSAPPPVNIPNTGDSGFILAPPIKPNRSAFVAPTESVSVVGIEESVGLENGEKWTDRSPTPTFTPRLASPHPPIPPTPEEIPNIYLEGPIPTPASRVLISDSQCEEVEFDDEEYEEEDADYDSENERPVVLSGKVTLSVLTGTPGGTGCGVLGGGGTTDDATEAPSFSAEDFIGDGITTPSGDLKVNVPQADVSGAIANAINDANGNGSSVPIANISQQASKGSSPEMDDFEVVGKDSLNGEEKEESAVDGDATHYTTADAEMAHFNLAGDETSADISVLEGLHEDEYDEEEDDEEEVEDEEDDEEGEDEEEDEEQDEDDEEEDEEDIPPETPSKGSSVRTSSTPSPALSGDKSSFSCGTYFTEP